MRKSIAALSLSMVCLVGCHQSSSPGDGQQAHVAQSEKQVLLDLVQRQYLWNHTVPSPGNLDAHATLPGLLDYLTAPARAQGKDKIGWTRLEKKATGPASASLAAGSVQAMGLGAGMDTRGSGVFITYILPGSGSHTAGLGRGDELLAAALTAPELHLPSSAVQALLASGNWQTLLEGNPGDVRHLRVRKAGTGVVQDLSVTFSWFSYDLVPGASAPVVLQAGVGHKVGYVLLGEFADPAEDQLRAVMAHFQQAGVTDLVLDLRYNGGGDLKTAVLLCNLLRGLAAPGAVLCKFKGNPSVPDEISRFQALPEAIQPVKIAVIATGRTASASEMVVNVLQPYYHQNLAIVGGRTFGKPVAQSGLPLPNSQWLLWLTTHRVLNAQDHGDYWKGLPDRGFLGASCAAEDDLAHALGNPGEASLAAALRWIEHGTSQNGPIPMPAPGAQASADQGLTAGAPLSLPPGINPNIPGLY
jgi:C-terminal processing protease CtpA/Prc